MIHKFLQMRCWTVITADDCVVISYFFFDQFQIQGNGDIEDICQFHYEKPDVSYERMRAVGLKLSDGLPQVKGIFIECLNPLISYCYVRISRYLIQCAFWFREAYTSSQETWIFRWTISPDISFGKWHISGDQEHFNFCCG